MVTAKAFRRIALGMQGAVEGAHMGHADFRAHGRIFASLHADLEHGMVKLAPADQARLVLTHAGGFAPEQGAWGRQGYTRVRLDAVDEDTLGEAMTVAWQQAAAPRRTARGTQPTTRRPAKTKRSR